jgi:competence protein ComEA
MDSFKLFNRWQQKVVLFLIASALVATAILITTHIQREKALSKIDIVHSAFEVFEEEIIPAKVNINTASLEELESLPRIGPAIANRIIEYRNTHGRFKSIEEITKVKGIGKKTFEKIKDMITVRDNIKKEKIDKNGEKVE